MLLRIYACHLFRCLTQYLSLSRLGFGETTGRGRKVEYEFQSSPESCNVSRKSIAGPHTGIRGALSGRKGKEGKEMREEGYSVRVRACVRALCFLYARVPCIFKSARNNRLLCMCFGHESLTRGMASPHRCSISAI